MNDITFTGSKGSALIAGGALFLISFKPDFVVSNPQILRPLLNVSWGYIFGSHLWTGISTKNKKHWENKILLDYSHTPSQEIVQSKLKATESRIYRMYLENLIYTNIIASGVLMVTTSALAPSNKLLRICSGLSLFISIGNLLCALPEEEKPEDIGVVKVVTSSCFLSELLSFFTFTSIVPYIFA